MKGYLFRKGKSWYLRYRDNFLEDGELVRRQKCVRLADVSDRYRSKGDLDELIAEKLAGVSASAKCPKSAERFETYVEETYLPYVKSAMKPSTYAGYSTCWKRYVKPRVSQRLLRDFSVKLISDLLRDCARMHKINRHSCGKIRSVLSAVFTFAICRGDYPARSESENPARGCMLPETAKRPTPTKAATFDQVKTILAALSDMPLERAAVGIVSMLGTRPGEARGLQWSDWSREKQQISISRSVWHTIEGTPKTEQSCRLVAVTPELKGILQDLHKAQGSPIDGYILAGVRDSKPVNLDNLAKRSIRRRLKELGILWPGWYSFRRFHGTAVRMKSTLETTSRALGNSRAVADKHYVQPVEVLPDVRKAVNEGVSGLIN